jgi:RNA polymerase-binding transcription factor DksA
MTEAQRKELHRQLLAERRRLVAALDRYGRETRESDERYRSGDLSAYPTHLADEGTDAIAQEVEASNAQRQSEELHEIDAALQRFYREPRHFGRCSVAGREIAFARLQVMPWTRTCQHHASDSARF